MLNRTSFTKINYSTPYSTQSDAEIIRSVIIDDSKNMHAKTELVLRAINGSKELKKEALDICNNTLAIIPGHNFFNLARAMLGEDAEREQFFKIAIQSPYSTDSDKTIQAQAAYQLARFLFDQGKYIESQAWLTQSIMLGHEKAEIDFCSRGMAKDFNDDPEEYFRHIAVPSHQFEKKASILQAYNISGPYGWTINYAMLIALILSNKKMQTINEKMDYEGAIVYCKVGSFYHDNFDRRYSWMYGSTFEIVKKANATISPSTSLLNPDTFLHEVATRSLKESRLFFEFMSYCAKNNIISNENYQLILKFIDRYSRSNNKQLLCNEGTKILKELNVSQPTDAVPQIMRHHSTANVMQVLQSASSASTVSIEPPQLYPSVATLNTTEFVQQFPAVPSNIPFGLYDISQNSYVDQSNQEAKLQPIYLQPGQ